LSYKLPIGTALIFECFMYFAENNV